METIALNDLTIGYHHNCIAAHLQASLSPAADPGPGGRQRGDHSPWRDVLIFLADDGAGQVRGAPEPKTAWGIDRWNMVTPSKA